MNIRPIKLTEQERTTIVNALTVAARQYQIARSALPSCAYRHDHL